MHVVASPEELRERMVAALAGYGVRDERILDAMRRVPRHAFLEHVTDLDVAHDVDRAVVVPGFDPERVTTSVSAPGIVAVMLQLLELSPGMHVLEIGAGSGYNAALLAQLGCIVTAVDIDETLIEPTQQRLTTLGYDVRVVHGDGDLGVVERAPYDRIVATVGCNDLSPAWFEQLAPDGFLLAPLKHGYLHPLVRASDHRSRPVGRSGFVRMLGRQDELPPWDLPPTDGWDAAYFTALRILPGEAHDDRAIAATVEEWRALGEPSMSDFASTWVPRGTGRGRWVIPRVHHDQVVELASARLRP